MGQRRFAIIGGGTFGLSIAWHLLKLEKNSEVVVFDNADQLAPSRAFSKFVRVDYPNEERTIEAMEAKRLWETHDLFAFYYHCTGRVVAYSPEYSSTLTQIVRTRAILGLPERKIHVTTSGTAMDNAIRIPSGYRWLHNEDDGTVSWDDAMQALKQDCIRKQATFHSVYVTHLVTDNSAIVGIATTKGYIPTTHVEVILAAGPWIAPLLAASSIERPPSQRFPVVTGMFAVLLRLDQTQQGLFRRFSPYSEIGKAEFVCGPVHPENAKITWVRPFTALKPWDVSKTDLAILTLLDARRWAKQRLPQLRITRILSIRSYWDGVTQDQRPLIARHPHFRNLLIAGGGSYTHAKDLPLIGKGAAKLAHDPEACGPYGWEQDEAGGHHNQPALSTTITFDELNLQASKDPRVLRWKADARSEIRTGKWNI